MDTNHTARSAAEANYRNGYDLCLASELADYEAEQEAEDERLEAEGRREMYQTLFGE